jgi:RimJ/RimL family protein N-acetyltransferase
MINEIMKLHPDAFAKVKLDNEASLRLFEKCGFKKRYYLLERE